MTESSPPRLGSLASQLRADLKDIWQAHRDSEAFGYNNCEEAECAWCEDTRKSIDDLDAALTALRTQVEQLEQEMQGVLDGSLAAPADDYIEKWVDALRDLRASLTPQDGGNGR